MADFLGTDLGRISGELEKLVIALPGVNHFTADHIEKNIGISREFSILELQNALGERNVLKANRIINHFGANPAQNPITRTISTLFFYFSRLFMYHFLQDKSEQTVAAKFGLHPFIAKLYIASAKKYTPAKLFEIIGVLREYDMRSKGFGGTTSTTEADLQKEMIYKILH
jgi:DNA polymerase-3 subunit delta